MIRYPQVYNYSPLFSNNKLRFNFFLAVCRGSTVGNYTSARVFDPKRPSRNGKETVVMIFVDCFIEIYR